MSTLHAPSGAAKIAPGSYLRLGMLATRGDKSGIWDVLQSEVTALQTQVTSMCIVMPMGYVFSTNIEH